jgi:hypothetical protein
MASWTIICSIHSDPSFQKLDDGSIRIHPPRMDGLAIQAKHEFI